MDAIFRTEENRFSVTSPRLVLYNNGCITVVRYKDTRWYGLPSGKLKTNELSGNLLDAGSIPGLAREIKEECGVDIGFAIDRMKFVGLAEYTTVNEQDKTATDYDSPILFLNIENFASLTEGLDAHPDLLTINTKLGNRPVPLLPDTSIVINMFIKRNGNLRGFLSDKDRQIYFQTKPNPQLLLQEPAWLLSFDKQTHISDNWQSI